jgi:hypothetical protein
VNGSSVAPPVRDVDHLAVAAFVVGRSEPDEDEFDSGGQWDLVVGAYREDLGSILNAGDVVVFKGKSTTQAGYQSTRSAGTMSEHDRHTRHSRKE